MLELIFGIWMNVSHIDYLRQYGSNCDVLFTEALHATIPNKSCDDVAAEINKRRRR